MSERLKLFAIAGSAGVITIPVFLLAYFKLSDWGFIGFVAVFFLVVTLVEPLVLNWGGNTGKASRTRGDQQTVVVLQELAPVGKVQLGPEIWNARSVDSEVIPKGQVVRVRATDGLTLLVEAEQQLEKAT